MTWAHQNHSSGNDFYLLPRVNYNFAIDQANHSSGLDSPAVVSALPTAMSAGSGDAQVHMPHLFVGPTPPLSGQPSMIPDDTNFKRTRARHDPSSSPNAILTFDPPLWQPPNSVHHAWTTNNSSGLATSLVLALNRPF